MKKYYVSIGTGTDKLSKSFVEENDKSEIVRDFLKEAYYMIDETLIVTENKEEALKVYNNTDSSYYFTVSDYGYELSATIIELSEEEGEYDEDGDWQAEEIAVIKKKCGDISF